MAPRKRVLCLLGLGSDLIRPKGKRQQTPKLQELGCVSLLQATPLSPLIPGSLLGGLGGRNAGGETHLGMKV